MLMSDFLNDKLEINIRLTLSLYHEQKFGPLNQRVKTQILL